MAFYKRFTEGWQIFSTQYFMLTCLHSFHWMISVTAILRKLKQQSRESVEDKRPKLLKALREVRTTLLHVSISVLTLLLHCTAFSPLMLRLPCSSETFIWSCTGTFRAGVSFPTSHRIDHLSLDGVSFLSADPIHSFSPPVQCLCCPGCFRQTLVKSTSKALTSGKIKTGPVNKWS